MKVFKKGLKIYYQSVPVWDEQAVRLEHVVEVVVDVETHLHAK